MASTGSVVKATLIAFFVSLIALLPPIIHFVTGPLGPAIGGYLAGNRLQLSEGEAGFVGLLAALLVGIPAPVLLIEVFHALPNLSIWVLIIASAFAALYTGLMTGVAAWYGGTQARKETDVAHE